MRPRKRLLVLIVSVLALAVWPSSGTPRALAHPLDEYLQALYVTLGSDRVGVELDLTPGVLVASPVIGLIDTDGDGQISNDEAQAYARGVLDQIRIDVDSSQYRLVPARVVFPPMLNLTAGAGTIQLEAVLEPTITQLQLPSGLHEVTVHNTYSPLKSAYQSAVILQSQSQINVHQQTRDEVQQSLRVDYSILAPSAAAPTPTTDQPFLGGVPAQEQAILNALAEPTQSQTLFLGALLLSAVLGGLHGLTPVTAKRSSPAI